MINRAFNVAVVAVIAAAAVFAWHDHVPKPSSASPSRVAGAYLDNLAHQNGVKIVGDKVWAVIPTGPDRVTVVIRVKFEPTATFSGPSTKPLPPQWATVYVREIRSDYSVVSAG